MTDDSEQERWTEHPSEWDDATLSCALKDDSLTEAMMEPVRKEAARRLRGGEGEREPPYCLDCGHPPAYHAGSHCAATMVGEDGEENPCGCESDRHFLGRDALSPTDGEEGHDVEVLDDGRLRKDYGRCKRCGKVGPPPYIAEDEWDDECGGKKEKLGELSERVQELGAKIEEHESRARPEEAGGEDEEFDPCENHPDRMAVGHTMDGVGLCRECAPSPQEDTGGYTDEDLEWAFDILLPDKPPAGDIDKVRDYEEKRTAIDCIRDRLRRPPEGAGQDDTEGASTGDLDGLYYCERCEAYYPDSSLHPTPTCDSCGQPILSPQHVCPGGSDD